MNRTDSSIWLIAAVVLLFCQAAMAVPTFQVYIKDGTPGTIGEDQDTWFGGGSPLGLIVVGAYNLGRQQRNRQAHTSYTRTVRARDRNGDDLDHRR